MDAPRATDLDNLLNLTHTINFNCSQILAFIQEADHLLNEKKYFEASLELDKAIKVIHELI